MKQVLAPENLAEYPEIIKMISSLPDLQSMFGAQTKRRQRLLDIAKDINIRPCLIPKTTKIRWAQV